MDKWTTAISLSMSTTPSRLPECMRCRRRVDRLQMMLDDAWTFNNHFMRMTYLDRMKRVQSLAERNIRIVFAIRREMPPNDLYLPNLTLRSSYSSRDWSRSRRIPPAISSSTGTTSNRAFSAVSRASLKGSRSIIMIPESESTALW